MHEDFTAWYEQRYPLVLTTLTAATGEPTVAEEATQEAFARAFERWAKVRRMRAPDGWVYTVALNAARRSLKHRTRTMASADPTSERPPPVAPLERDPEVWQALSTLGDREREAVVLRYLADLKERDVARVMGLRPGTVARTLHDARRKLALTLADDDPQEGQDNAD